MSIFKNLKNEGLEETQDRLGGGFQPLDSGAYTGTIKAAYAGKSSSSEAMSVTFILDLDGLDREYRETFWVTNGKGENFFLNKNDNSKKVPLPGFTIVDDICMVTAEKPLFEVEPEEKTIKLYDYEAKKEVPTSVQMLVELIGQKVTFGVLKVQENKSKKEGNEYVATAEEREINTTDKVFHYPSNVTVPEARQGITDAVFFDAWVQRNKGVTRDKRTIKDGKSAQAGKSGRPAGGPPQAADTGAKKTSSLFGNK